MQIDLNEAKQRVKEGYRRYYSLKKIAESLRESWLRDLTTTRAKNEDLNQGSVYKTLLLNEK